MSRPKISGVLRKSAILKAFPLVGYEYRGPAPRDKSFPIYHIWYRATSGPLWIESRCRWPGSAVFWREVLGGDERARIGEVEDRVLARRHRDLLLPHARAA